MSFGSTSELVQHHLRQDRGDTLDRIIEDLRHKTGAIHTIEQRAPVRRSYRQLYDDVIAAQRQLRSWGVAPGLRVGIYAPNSYRWLVFDLALIAIGAVSVPFTDDFQGAVDGELISRYDLSLLLLAKSHAHLFPERPAHVGFLDTDNAGTRVLVRRGSAEADAADQLSLVFSSGSAGGLKGLVISRKGVISSLPPILDAVGVTSSDRLLLFLPMSNFQQRFLCYGALWYDYDIVLTEYAQLFGAMKQLDPTILVAPPILYQMLYAEHLGRPRWRRHIQSALGALLSRLSGAAARRAVARRIFPQLHGQFGKQMRLLITGMAPIAPSVAQFFERAQLPLCEAYGMVEAGVMAYRNTGSCKSGSVGKPVRDVQVSIEQDGEITIRRPNPVALRYFQCAEGENEKTFIAPGAIATGDLGKLDSDGNLILLGRKKELIVLPSGQKIHPEVVEADLNQCPSVSNAVVFRKKDAGHLIAVIEPRDIQDSLAKKRIAGFVEQLRAQKRTLPFIELVFAQDSFSRENRMLRPNMKIDRKAIAARYAR